MHLHAVKQRTTFAVNIATLMTSQLFTLCPGVLPVAALVFYELNLSKGLYFPCKSRYLICLISNILKQVTQFMLGT